MAIIDVNDCNDLTAKDLLDSMKDFVKQTNEEIPSAMFVPDIEDEKVWVLDISQIGREHITDALKQAVMETKCTRYFGTYVAYVTQTDDMKQRLLKDFKKLKRVNGEIDKADFLKFLQKLKACTQKPSQNPMRKEVLLAMVFDKKKGSDALMCELKKRNGKYVFGKTTNLNKGHSFNRFDIWYPEQVVLDDKDL